MTDRPPDALDPTRCGGCYTATTYLLHDDPVADLTRRKTVRRWAQCERPAGHPAHLPCGPVDR